MDSSEILEYFKGNYNFVFVGLIISFLYFYLSESPKTYQQKQKHQYNSLKNCAFVCIFIAIALKINNSSELSSSYINPLDIDLSPAIDMISQNTKTVMEEFIPGSANF